MTEEIIIIGIIIAYIVFVAGINYWNYRDHKKTMDRIYGR